MMTPADYWAVAGLVSVLHPVWFGGFAAVWGGFWASFLGLVAWRAPIMWAHFRADAPVLRLQPPTLWGRSSCDHCGTPIPFYRNIPVLTWCGQGGKTACCDQPLGVHHVIGEALWVVGLPVWCTLAWSQPMQLMVGVVSASALHVVCFLRPWQRRRSAA